MSTMHRSSLSWWAVICLLVMLTGYVLSLPVEEDTRVEKPLGGVPDSGSVHEEVVVAAALYVRKKDPTTLRRQKRVVRNDHVTHHHSTSNRFETPGKREPHLGKQHDKVLTNWKNDIVTSAKVEHRKQ
uniref:Secreted protein n=1 Tax=Anopheles christyi TaxID=43041 RepID=A0A182KGW4_9DIPT